MKYGAALSALPHPLEKFARIAPLSSEQTLYADALLRRIQAFTLCPNLMLGKEAEEFLLRDDWQFQVICKLAGIDAGKLRSHLERCRNGGSH